MEVAWNCIAKVGLTCLNLKLRTFRSTGLSLFPITKKIPRPPNSFGLFLKDVKDSIVHGGRGQFLKNAAIEWKNLPYPEKQKYADKAQQDFAEYKEAMNSLSDVDRDEIKEEKVQQKLARTRRKEKQLKVSFGLPKRPATAYNFFVKHVFATNQLSTHGKSVTELMPEVYQKWESLPFEQKEKFAELSSQDGKRYLEEMKVYVTRLREEGKDELIPQRYKKMWLVD